MPTLGDPIIFAPPLTEVNKYGNYNQTKNRKKKPLRQYESETYQKGFKIGNRIWILQDKRKKKRNQLIKSNNIASQKRISSEMKVIDSKIALDRARANLLDEKLNERRAKAITKAKKKRKSKR